MPSSLTLVRRPASDRSRVCQVTWLAVLAPMIVGACASAPPKPRQLGQYSALTPRLAVVDSERPPVNLTVDLAGPASVVVVYVAPGRSTRIVYPADTLGVAPLRGGTQRIAATWPRPRPDSARRDTARADRPGPGGQARARRDTTRGAPTRMGPALPDPEAGLAPMGYLLLIATPAQLSYRDVRRKVEGVTTPLDPDEALNAIAKQVAATLDPAAQWAGYAVEVTVARETEGRGARSEGRAGVSRHTSG